MKREFTRRGFLSATAAAPVAPTAAFFRNVRLELSTADVAVAVGFLLFMLGSLGRRASRLADREVGCPADSNAES
jgi:hypothetical protein